MTAAPLDQRVARENNDHTRIEGKKAIRDRRESPSTLSAAHLEKLKSSGLSQAQAHDLGWYTDHEGALVIPYLQFDGRPATYRHSSGKDHPFHRRRPNWSAEQQATNPPKYVSPKGAGNLLFHCPLAIKAGGYLERLHGINVPLRITEGELKTCAGTVHDSKRVTVGLAGVWGWVDRYDGREESLPLPELTEVPLQGREVRLCFDSDLQKPQVRSALEKLAAFLNSRGAHVLIERLPNDRSSSGDIERLGADDLIARYGAAFFLEVAAMAHPAWLLKGKDLHFNLPTEPTKTADRSTYFYGMRGWKWKGDPEGRDRWRRWTGSHWERVVGNDAIEAELQDFALAQGWRNAREYTAIRSWVADLRRTVGPFRPGSLRGMIPFLNGVLRLEDGTLLPHDPDRSNEWALPFAHDTAATCPGIHAFLLDRLGDHDSVSLLRAFARSALTGQRPKAFLEITGTSNTGKSIVARLLEAMVGPGNTTAGSLHTLEDQTQRFETIRYQGARLALFNEAHRYSGPLETLKAMTGGDAIRAERKGSHDATNFVFEGIVVLVGNGPIRPSDTSGAVINRRRSLQVSKVVQASDELELLEPDSHGWRGHLAGELAGLANWALAMPEADARRALARDVVSIPRAEAELETLLETDSLADWADEWLTFEPELTPEGHPAVVARVGHKDSEADDFLYANYLRHLSRQSKDYYPLSLKVFKRKLVDLLRDTLGLQLPIGQINSGYYRDRRLGSVVPMLRLWRTTRDAGLPGVIRQAVMARAGAVAEEATSGRTWIASGRTLHDSSPLGDGWDSRDGFVGNRYIGESKPDVFPHTEERGTGAISAIPSVTDVSIERHAVVNHHSRPITTNAEKAHYAKRSTVGEWVTMAMTNGHRSAAAIRQWAAEHGQPLTDEEIEQEMWPNGGALPLLEALQATSDTAPLEKWEPRQGEQWQQCGPPYEVEGVHYVPLVEASSGFASVSALTPQALAGFGLVPDNINNSQPTNQ